MKIRIKKKFKTFKGELREGQILDVSSKVAYRWNQEGKCVLLKIIEPKEAKQYGEET